MMLWSLTCMAVWKGMGKEVTSNKGENIDNKKLHLTIYMYTSQLMFLFLSNV